METKVCESCNKEFQYNLKPGFPRKYCTTCGYEKKLSFANKDKEVEEKAPLAGMASAKVPSMADIPVKVKAMRTAPEITATEKLRYSIKLFEAYRGDKGFIECQELVEECYKRFLV